MSLSKKYPRIQWSDGITPITYDFEYPPDNVTTYSLPRKGTITVSSPVGVQDSWYVGTDYYIELDARHISPDTTTGFTALARLIEYGRGVRQQDGETLRFYPDNTNLGVFYNVVIVSPTDAESQLEGDGSRTLRLVLRTDSPITGY